MLADTAEQYHLNLDSPMGLVGWWGVNAVKCLSDLGE